MSGRRVADRGRKTGDGRPATEDRRPALVLPAFVEDEGMGGRDGALGSRSSFLNWHPTQLKYVSRLAYGEALPRAEEDREGSVQVYGSNGSFANYSYANTYSPAIIVGRKGSYGKVNWSSEPCFATDTTFFIDSSTTGHNLRWLFYVLQTLNLDKGSDEAAVPGLNREDAYEKIVLVPPLTTQRAIAAYLDEKTAQIDALINAKQRLLALLAEKRRALVTHAVTRGLNPAAPMRDSGVPWTGAVPEHWEVVPVKHIAAIRYGLSQPPPITNVDNGLPFVRATNVKQGQLSREGLIFVDPKDVPMSRDAVLEENDIIVVRSGAYTGDSAIVTSEFAGAIAGYDMVVRCRRNCVPHFLAWVFLSTATLNAQINLIRLRAAQPHLNAEELGEIILTLPPIQEQSDIAEFIEQQTQQIQNLQGLTKKSIDLLHERRATLIAAAVTGQIEVEQP